nr:unnamed protein product [Spirometra erinaceieuropaei]
MSGLDRTPNMGCTPKESDNRDFCIDHSGEIAAHISELFNNKAYSDISLIVKSTEFPAHRVILASRSEYFRALFYGGLSEAHSSTVHLNGISDIAFYHILCYIYTGKLNLSGLAHEDVLDILGLACQYNFVNLQAALSKHFTHSLTLSNICSVYDAAIVYDLEELVLACLEFVDRFAPTVLSMPQFERLSKASVIRVITRDSFYAPEFEILRGVQRWLDATYQACIEEALQELQNTQCKKPQPALASSEETAPKLDASPASTSSESLFGGSTGAGGGRFVLLFVSPAIFTSSPLLDFKTSSLDGGAASLPAGTLKRIKREAEERRNELIKCIRFELMSLSELSTEVRASKLLSADALLDAISSKTLKTSDQLNLRGRLLPEVNLAVPRLGCSLVAGNRGNYPFFFLDTTPTNELSGLQVPEVDLSTAGGTRPVQRGFADPSQSHRAAGQRFPRLSSTPQPSTSHHPRADGLIPDDISPPQPDPQSAVNGSTSWSKPIMPSFTARPFHRSGLLDNDATQLNTWVRHQQQQASGPQPLQTVVNQADSFGSPTVDLRDGPYQQHAATTASPKATPLSGLPTSSTPDRRGPPAAATPPLRSRVASTASMDSFFSTTAAASGTHGEHPTPPGGGLTPDPAVRGRAPHAHGRAGSGCVRTPNVPPPESEFSVVSHPIGVCGGEIVVDLGHNSFVNMISMQLWDREPRSYSYYVEVALSKDGTWHRVVDYSNYACRSWQTLYFPARVIRLIRIVGTRSSGSQYFHLVTFQCFYTREQFKVHNDLLIPRNNVATVQLGATVLEGVSRLRNSLIDGDVLVYNLNYGFTCHQLGNGCIAVQLSQPFLVSSMRFLLWDLDSRAYSYTVEVSLDRQVWRMVFDASMMHCRSWQTIKFPLQPVTFIRVTGTGNTANNVFHLVHLECPASTLDPDAVVSGTAAVVDADEVYESNIQASDHNDSHGHLQLEQIIAPIDPIFPPSGQPPSVQAPREHRQLAFHRLRGNGRAGQTTAAVVASRTRPSQQTTGDHLPPAEPPQFDLRNFSLTSDHHHRGSTCCSPALKPYQAALEPCRIVHATPSSSSLQALSSRTTSLSSIRPQSGDEEDSVLLAAESSQFDHASASAVAAAGTSATSCSSPQLPSAATPSGRCGSKSSESSESLGSATSPAGQRDFAGG